MATVAELIRVRKAALKRLQKASLDLDYKQEKVEREVKRLLIRKKAIPESADMVRVLGLIKEVAVALDTIAKVAQDTMSLYGA